MRILKLLNLIILLFIISCEKKEIIVLPEVLPEEIITTPYPNSIGPIIMNYDKEFNNICVLYYTMEKDNGKLAVFFPNTNFILYENNYNNFHCFKINNLGNILSYKILSTNTNLNEKYSQLKLPYNYPIKVGICNYNGTNYEIISKIINNFKRLKINFFIHIENNSLSKNNPNYWYEIFEKYRDLLDTVLFIPVYNDINLFNKFDNNFSTYRSILLKGTHILILNSDENFTDNDLQCKWLENEIIDNNFWKIALFSKHLVDFNYETTNSFNNNIEKQLIKKKINLVINNANNGYEKYEKNNILYVISGFDENNTSSNNNNKYLLKSFPSIPNYIIMDITEKKIIGNVYNIDGNILDVFELIE